MGVAMN